MPLSESYSAGDALPAADVAAMAKAINRGFYAGKIDDFFGLEADVPSGFLLANAKTIGDASSNATGRANADMSLLFALLWSVGNTDGSLAIFTSAGAGSTYGANAAADFAAHKAIALPDFRGRVAVGNDDMGGSDAGRIVTNDAQSEKVGGSCGAENHQLITAELPSHTHTVGYNDGGTGGAGGVPDENSSGAIYTHNTGSTGSDTAHNNMQPSMFLNKIICTGVVW